ncbi:hypothetical protein AAVH_42130 [Aphelenchoides avenae]|nr:hypothetical protein AAVH_42130 [Aphelenchus avenae]
MGTVLMFVRRRLSSSAQLTSKGQDTKLLIHSLFMFALQLCLTLHCFVLATDWFGLQEMFYENNIPAALVVPKWLRLWSYDCCWRCQLRR